MKSFSFTKLIMGVMLALNIAVVIFAFVMMWRTMDLSPLGYLLIGESCPFAVWLRTYGKKEGSANNSKYAMLFTDKYAKEYGPETAIRIAEVVLQNQGG